MQQAMKLRKADTKHAMQPMHIWKKIKIICHDYFNLYHCWLDLVVKIRL
jgi:hypothetical protein